MTEKQIESYYRIVNLIRENTKIVRPERPKIKGPLGKVETPLTERELLWKELAQGIYVITSEYVPQSFFDEQSTKLGFNQLVNKVYIFHTHDIPPKYDIDIDVLRGWFYENGAKSEEDFKVALQSIGCHVSQSMAIDDFLRTNGNRILLFEDDCAFNRVVSNEWLKDFTEILNNNSIGYFHLGWEMSPWEIKEEQKIRYENIEIHKMHLNYTYAHSYILDRTESERFVDSLDIESDVPEIKDTDLESIKEFIYRSQADDYFTYFVDGYCLDKALTYQQKIIHNKEQGFKHV